MKPPPIRLELAAWGEPLLHARVPSEYMDANRHMNIRYYLHLFDDAGDTLAASLGLTREFHAAHGTGGFDLEHHLHYLRESREGDEVSVYARVVGCTAKRWHYVLFLVSETRKEVAATFECVNSFADLTERRTAAFPPEILASIRRRAEADRWPDGVPSPLSGVMAP